MYILELIKPGSWLEHKFIGEDKNFELSGLLNSLIENFYEANLCLNLFSQEREYREKIHSSDYIEAERKKESDFHREASEQIRGQFDHLPFMERHGEEDIYIKRLKWSSGIHPKQFQSKKIFLYAKSFLFAIDNFSKLLNVISSKQYNPPHEVHVAITNLAVIFPNLRGIRNSSHHGEDILRGLGMIRGKLTPFKPLPIDNGSIKTEGGALLTNSLNNNNYGQTLGDGTFEEIEISFEKLDEVKVCLQSILDCYSWRGYKVLLPD